MLALREGDDENSQLAALSELCELLAVSSEDALAMFPVDSLVPVLVRPGGGGTSLRPVSRACNTLEFHLTTKKKLADSCTSGVIITRNAIQLVDNPLRQLFEFLRRF